VPYRLNPMGTVLEGDYDEVMKVVRECFLELKKDCRRISVSIRSITGRAASREWTLK